MPDGGYATAEGPEHYGSTQTQQFRVIWAVWNSSTTVRVGKWAEGLGDALGADLSLMNDSGTWVRPARFTLAFDQDALPVIAYQKDATTVSVRKYVASVKTEFTFAGLSPVLFYNGTVIVATGTTDVCCLYLDANGDKLFARFQRENFATEYLVNQFPPGVVLSRLQHAQHIRINGTNYMQTWGIDDQGRQIVLRSEAYEPDLIVAFDKLTLDAGAESGENLNSISITNAIDKLTSDTTAESGELVSTIIVRTLPADKITQDHTSDGGSYVLTVIGITAPGDKATLDSTAEDGVYFNSVRQGDDKRDKLTLDNSADSGNYP